MGGEDQPVMRPEFELYVKMTAEAMTSIAKSTEESAKESRESNQILREYIITNNHKHDETGNRITSLAKKMSRIEDAVKANSKVTNFAMTIKKGIVIIVVSVLGAVGTMIGYGFFG